MDRSLSNRMWHVAGQILILLLLFPTLTGASPDRMAESLQTAQSADHAPVSTHDCCPSDSEPISGKENAQDHCSGTFFCACSLQATPSSKGTVPGPDQPLILRGITSVDSLPTPTNNPQPAEFTIPPGTPPPLWLAHQALLN